MIAPIIEKFQDWQICTNRINPLLSKVAEGADKFINALDEPVKTEYRLVIKNRIFSYWDTYHSNGIEPDLIRRSDVVRTLPKRLTNPLSDKMLLGREIVKHGLSAQFPRTYESVDEALRFIDIEGTPLLFIKHRGGSAGLQVSCIKSSELINFQLERDYIIQEGVSDILLLENRKLEFRFYILVFNKSIYLSKHAFSYIHSGEKFDALSTDYLMQIKKTDGVYFRRDVGNDAIKVSPLFELENFKSYRDQLYKLSLAITPVLETVRQKSDDNSYILLGCDSISCQNGSMKLIEINTYPNLVHVDAKINELVNVPVLSSLLLITTTGLSNHSWIAIN